jgi:murein DD-endopeptidase MepM/ murein hydrolase activator NlpD
MRGILLLPGVGACLVMLAGCLPPIPAPLFNDAGPSSAPAQAPNEATEPAVGGERARGGGEPLRITPIEVTPVRAPERDRPAPARDERRRLVAAADEGLYVVPRGKTLYAISRESGTAVPELIRLNRLAEPYHLQAGQTIRLRPAATLVARRETGPTTAATKPDPVEAERAGAAKPAAIEYAASDATAPRRVPRPAVELGRAAKPAVLNGEAPAAKAEPASLRRARPGEPPPRAGAHFLWPVSGKLLTRFGKQGGGVQSDGIAIAVPMGTPVVAAENGVVAYAGSDLKAYGQLLLVRHADGWMTAYAYNDELVVQPGEVVRRGQVIARSGASGNVRDPQTYFEIRHEGRPVDPLPRLAKS